MQLYESCVTCGNLEHSFVQILIYRSVSVASQALTMAKAEVLILLIFLRTYFASMQNQKCPENLSDTNETFYIDGQYFLGAYNEASDNITESVFHILSDNQEYRTCVDIELQATDQTVVLSCATMEHSFNYTTDGKTLKLASDGLKYRIISYEKFKYFVLEHCVNYIEGAKHAIWIFMGQEPMSIERGNILRNEVEIMEEMYQIETFSYVKRGQHYKKKCFCKGFDLEFTK